MYSNQTLVQERPLLAKQGILGTNYWYGARPQKAGAFLFQTNCGACHTLDGANNVLKCVRDRSEDGIYVIIAHTHEMVPWMSPFTGTDHEQRVLANFLYTRSNRLPASATLDDGPATPRPRLDSLSDLPLPKPISPGWIHGLLFTGFSLHLLFVLFTLGTAILGMYYFLRSRWHDTREEPRWEHGILHRFMAVKSLAVVLGIAPLLLIQVGFTVSFFTAINLFGSFWLLIIVLLILAFLAFDIVGQYRRLNPYLGLALGLAGLALLLAVPGIFVGVLIMSENSRSWLPMLQQGGKMPVALSVHWLFRYLHILGAGVVFAAVLHFFQTSRENVRLRASLLRFVLGGLLFQVVVGAMLYLSLPHRPEAITNAGLFFGVAAVLGLIGTQFALRTLPARTAPALLAVILLGMLMTRQLLQWQGMAPVERTATQAVARLQSELAAHREEALAAYQGDQQAVYDQGSTIYRRSCAFCHGANAQGNGSAAAALAILPENLTAIRTTRPYLTRLLAEGIPGTGMPFFSIFTTDKLDLVIDDLNSHYSLLDAPEPVSPPVSPAVKQRARDRYRQSCIACHGQDGRGQTDMLSNLTPPPPDFTQYTLQPDYMLSIITNGYHGTAMSGHANLPVDVRRGLVEIVQEFYRK